MNRPSLGSCARGQLADDQHRLQEPSCPGFDSKGAGNSGRGARISSISAMLLAFLASQHHNLMMLLFAFGLSDLAMSFMTAMPIIRNIMLGMSLTMVAVIIWQIRDPARPRSMRIMGAVSIAATIGLSAWSISQFGW